MEKNVKIIIGIVISLLGIIVLGSDYYLSLKHEVFDDMNKKYYEQNVVVDDLTKKINLNGNIYYYLFSLSGFASSLVELANDNSNIKLITLDNIFE